MNKLISPNTVRHHATVTRQRREKLNEHKGVIVWFTGLSGAGKSMLAHAVDTGSQTLEACVDEVIELLESRGIIMS